MGSGSSPETREAKCPHCTVVLKWSNGLRKHVEVCCHLPITLWTVAWNFDTSSIYLTLPSLCAPLRTFIIRKQDFSIANNARSNTRNWVSFVDMRTRFTASAPIANRNLEGYSNTHPTAKAVQIRHGHENISFGCFGWKCLELRRYQKQGIVVVMLR